MSYRFALVFLFCTALLSSAAVDTIHAQPSATGEVMFVAYNADGDKGLAFVTLVDVPNSSSIFFTDNEWDGGSPGFGGSFNTGEGTLTWQNNSGSTISAGTVITLTNVNSGSVAASSGTVSRSGSFNPGADNEVVYAYVGTDVNTPTAVLTAIANNDFSSGTISGTGLVDGTDANSLDGINAGADVAVYQGSTTCSSTLAACAQTIATVNGTNWVAQDASGDQSQDATTPDFPDNVPGNFSGSALPVELISFKAITDSENIRLYWETASETNNAGFEVQLQVGKRFTSLAFIEGAGTTTEAQTYSHEVADLTSGVHVFRLKQVDFDGRFEYSPAVEVAIGLPETFRLSEAYPNPFNPETQFSLTVAIQQEVHVAVFDMMGREVTVLFQGTLEANQTKAFVFDAGNLPSGQYMYRVVGKTFNTSRTVTLLK